MAKNVGDGGALDFIMAHLDIQPFWNRTLQSSMALCQDGLLHGLPVYQIVSHKPWSYFKKQNYINDTII